MSTTDRKYSIVETVFIRSYIETALWSSMDNSDPNTGGDPLDKHYDPDDIAPETAAKMAADCVDFHGKYGHLYDDARQAGHDFWLTRNGHGAGFWDGDYPEPQATQLTDASKTYGEYDLYIGDDGQIHGSPNR